jgi:hypothetical protein
MKSGAVFSVATASACGDRENSTALLTALHEPGRRLHRLFGVRSVTQFDAKDSQPRSTMAQIHPDVAV